MAFQIFFSLRVVLFDLILESHFFSAEDFNLLSDDFEPFFKVIYRISPFGKIAANYDFRFGKILLVDKGRNNFLLIPI
jgi:hypothetical protein